MRAKIDRQFKSQNANEVYYKILCDGVGPGASVDDA